MKNIIFCILISLCTIIPGFAGNNFGESVTVERIYVSTDKECYIAGESVWISLFCFDTGKDSPVLSAMSSIAYIELQSSTGIVAKTKVAIISGRGSGRVELPTSTPTGNYRMIAYTANMRNESEVHYFDKVLTVYNTLTNERDKSCTIDETDTSSLSGQLPITAETRPILMEIPKTVLLDMSGNQFRQNADVTFGLSNKYDLSMTLSVSIVNEDDISTYKNLPIYNYMESGFSKNDANFGIQVTPEFEGEIIKGRVSSISDGKRIDSLAGQKIFLSVVGGDSEIYTSIIDSAGRFVFYTTNIYGNADLIAEIPQLDTNSRFNIELDDNFLYPSVKKIPTLLLRRSFEKDLLKRSLAMQLNRRYGVDTIFSKYLPEHTPLLSGNCKTYLLDNYTRFPDMEEVVIEFIPELRFKKIDKKSYLQVRWESSFMDLAFSKDNTLTIIDGVPVFDHNKVLKYDPLKVKSINIYEGVYYLGNAEFTGIVDFKTYKKDFPNFVLPLNAKLLAFNGTSKPCRLIGDTAGDLLPDYRTTILWDPDIRISPKGSARLKFHTPDYPGRFVMTVEGVDTSGKPIYLQTKFTVF
ncbi:MAG: hypothetical protein PHT25_05695 [Bacteroidales bacterium]|nr:hypothetical protein [Bacteroidales bacterium]